MKPSRAMIPGEMSWAFIALIYGWSGSGFLGLLPPGPLHSLVLGVSDPMLWSLVLIVPALALLVLGFREWHAHIKCGEEDKEPWTLAQVQWSVSWRARLCICMVFSWMYLAKVIFDAMVAHNRYGISSLIFVAFGGVVFMWWFYKENRRVKREVRKNTAGITAASH